MIWGADQPTFAGGSNVPIAVNRKVEELSFASMAMKPKVVTQILVSALRNLLVPAQAVN